VGGREVERAEERKPAKGETPFCQGSSLETTENM